MTEYVPFTDNVSSLFLLYMIRQVATTLVCPASGHLIPVTNEEKIRASSMRTLVDMAFN